MAYSATTMPMEKGHIYHICSRAVGNEQIFRQEEDYHCFLGVIGEKLLPLSEIYAYVLLSNHYHLMLKVLADPLPVAKAMGEIGGSHAKWYNHKYKRKGGLFISPYKRRDVSADADLAWTPWYIYRNPLHHGITKDWRGYKWSSFQAYASGKPSRLNTSFLLDFFGGLDKMIAHHALNAEGWEGVEVE
jgi:putative transposase